MSITVPYTSMAALSIFSQTSRETQKAQKALKDVTAFILATDWGVQLTYPNGDFSRPVPVTQQKVYIGCRWWGMCQWGIGGACAPVGMCQWGRQQVTGDKALVLGTDR